MLNIKYIILPIFMILNLNCVNANCMVLDKKKEKKIIKISSKVNLLYTWKIPSKNIGTVFNTKIINKNSIFVTTTKGKLIHLNLTNNVKRIKINNKKNFFVTDIEKKSESEYWLILGKHISDIEVALWNKKKSTLIFNRLIKTPLQLNWIKERKELWVVENGDLLKILKNKKYSNYKRNVINIFQTESLLMYDHKDDNSSFVEYSDKNKIEWKRIKSNENERLLGAYKSKFLIMYRPSSRSFSSPNIVYLKSFRGVAMEDLLFLDIPCIPGDFKDKYLVVYYIDGENSVVKLYEINY